MRFEYSDVAIGENIEHGILFVVMAPAGCSGGTVHLKHEPYGGADASDYRFARTSLSFAENADGTEALA